MFDPPPRAAAPAAAISMRGMAIVHQAQLAPSKLELLNVWLPTRPWYSGSTTPELQRVSAYRFDDPAGEVGIETLLVQAPGGPLFQVPLTYRGAPLAGHEAHLVGTSDHSVLGPRWVYDGVGDPVYAQALAHAILTGGTEAEEYVDIDGVPVRRDPSMTVRGSGSAEASVPAIAAVSIIEDADPAVVGAAGLNLIITRVLAGAAPPGSASGGSALEGSAQDGSAQERGTLAGAWLAGAAPVVLARAVKV